MLINGGLRYAQHKKKKTITPMKCYQNNVAPVFEICLIIVARESPPFQVAKLCSQVAKSITKEKFGYPL